MTSKKDMGIFRKWLLTENRKALRFLHDAQGFDFEADHILLSFPGKFTYNTVKKAVEGEIPDGKFFSDYAVSLLIKTTKKCYNPDELYFVTVKGSKFDAERQTGISYWDYSIGYAWGVGDFEALRKQYTDPIYIVAQHKDFLRQPKTPKLLDLSARYIYHPDKDRRCGDGKGHKWISGITLTHTDGSAAVTEYEPYKHITNFPSDRSNDVRAIIDKSGYLVFPRRAELKRRADALRAERKKAEVDATDFTEETDRVAHAIAECKLMISDTVLRAQTADEVRKADLAITTLWHLVDRFEAHKQRVADRKYRSLQDARYWLDLMDKNAAEIKAALN